MLVMAIAMSGFEELEFVAPIALLRRSAIEVDIYTVDNEEVDGKHGLTIANFKTLKDINLEDYGCLFIPGGPHYKQIERNQTIIKIIKYFDQKHKIIATICAAPTILGRLGLLAKRNYTCFTSMNEDFGGTYIDEYVVVDDNYVTGRSAAASIDFGLKLIEKINGSAAVDKIKKDIYY